MRSRAEICKVSLTVKADDRVFRQILDKLHLVRFILFLHKCDGFLSRQFKPLDDRILLDDLLHLFFNGIQIFTGKRRHIKIIVKSFLNGRSNGKLCLRVETFHRLRQHMGSGVAERQLTLIILESEYI